MAQNTAQPEEAKKLEQQRLKEQQDRAKMQQEQKQQQRTDEEDAGADPAPGPMPEAAPPNSSKSRFGAGVIRKNEKPLDDE